MDKLQEEFKEIINQRGIELLNNNVQIIGILADLCPKEVKKRKLLSQVIDNNIGCQFYQIAITKDDYGIQIDTLRKCMLEELFLTSEETEYVIETFCYALSLNIDSEIQEVNTNTELPVISKPILIFLTIFLGGYGIEFFYLRKTKLGIITLLLCWTVIPAILSMLFGVVLIFIPKKILRSF